MESQKEIITFLVSPELAAVIKQKARERNKSVSLFLREVCSYLFEENGNENVDPTAPVNGRGTLSTQADVKTNRS